MRPWDKRKPRGGGTKCQGPGCRKTANSGNKCKRTAVGGGALRKAVPTLHGRDGTRIRARVSLGLWSSEWLLRLVVSVRLPNVATYARCLGHNWMVLYFTPFGPAETLRYICRPLPSSRFNPQPRTLPWRDCAALGPPFPDPTVLGSAAGTTSDGTLSTATTTSGTSSSSSTSNGTTSIGTTSSLPAAVGHPSPEAARLLLLLHAACSFGHIASLRHRKGGGGGFALAQAQPYLSTGSTNVRVRLLLGVADTLPQ